MNFLDCEHTVTAKAKDLESGDVYNYCVGCGMIEPELMMSLTNPNKEEYN